MRIIVLMLLTLTACDGTRDLSFSIVNPENLNKNPWLKLQGLPEFNYQVHSDGCSGGMSAMYAQLKFLHKKHGNTLEWHQCCVEHDNAYFYGGSSQEKNQADAKLNSCVTQIVGNKYLGKAMQIAVKIGGGPNLPTPYRWGYGEDFR